MGVANIPEQKDQRESNEWITLKPRHGKMETTKGKAEDFITVVSVGNQVTHPENFVTVLSIGSGRKDDEQTPVIKSLMNGADPHLEEEVQVYRLPGERLGFGLKFEGGNKTSERVKRLFIQSCADQSPASRTKCSWGSLGEGDEILSIDGVPVTHMTRLDCVRRLKESQLVIKLVVRCRGALRPEVVSAERKSTPEKSKIPPELPSAPPPVPPRKLRHPRGSADGEANPSPVKKAWDSTKSSPTSQNGSPQSQSSFHGSNTSSSKSSAYESCYSSPKIGIGSKHESPKAMPKEFSSDQKFKQEPPEAMVYLDARIQDASSTHGSTSDETSSSLSTVVDRFSTSDRVSTISTASTTSEQHGPESIKSNLTNDHYEDSKVKEFLTDGLNLTGMLAPLDQLELEFTSNPPDYLLTRLANSEAVTHVESRGDVERVTAVVAPNTVLIEETITLQPPLSFQDAPLSYGHEVSPGLFYTDLAADSKTHFRPIKDDASIVESVNGDVDQLPPGIIDNQQQTNSDPRFSIINGSAPPLPIKNHVNRIPVNLQTLNGQIRSDADHLLESDTPLLPPKPMPRKDLKARRKRPPPPPPPPNSIPRREVPPLPKDEVNSGQAPAIRKQSDPKIEMDVSGEMEDSCETQKSKEQLCVERELGLEKEVEMEKDVKEMKLEKEMKLQKEAKLEKWVNLEKETEEKLEKWVKLEEEKEERSEKWVNLEEEKEPEVENEIKLEKEGKLVNSEKKVNMEKETKLEKEAKLEKWINLEKETKLEKVGNLEKEVNLEKDLRDEKELNSQKETNSEKELRREDEISEKESKILVSKNLEEGQGDLHEEPGAFEKSSNSDQKINNLEEGTQLTEKETPEREPKIPENRSRNPENRSGTKEKGLRISEKGSGILEKGAKTSVKDSKTVEKGSKTLEKGSKIPEKGSKIPEKGSRILDKGSKILGKGSKTPEKGSKILEKSSKTVEKGSKILEKSSKNLEKGSKTSDRVSKILENGSKIAGKLQIPEKKSKQPESKISEKESSNFQKGSRNSEIVTNLESSLEKNSRTEKESNLEDPVKEKKINLDNPRKEKESLLENPREEKELKDEILGKESSQKNSCLEKGPRIQEKGKKSSRHLENESRKKSNLKTTAKNSESAKSENEEKDKISKSKSKFPVVDSKTNKMLDIIEMKIKMSDQSQQKKSLTISDNAEDVRRIKKSSESKKCEDDLLNSSEKRKLTDLSNETISIEVEDSEDERVLEKREKNRGSEKVLEKKENLVDGGVLRKEENYKKDGVLKNKEIQKEENCRNLEGESDENDLIEKEERLLDKRKAFCFLDESDFSEEKREEIENEIEANSVEFEEIDECDLVMKETEIENLEEDNICSDDDNVSNEIQVKRCYKREQLMDDEDDSSEESDAGDYYWQSNLATIGEEEETNSLEYTNANKEENDLEEKAEKDQLEIPSVFVKECSKNVRDEVDAVRQIAKDFGTEDKKPDKNSVNGRMDNCGGGQRLPPDGDEFPAAYQEFTNHGQYQFVASTNIATMATNGNILCQNQTYVASESFQVHPKTNKSNQSIEKIQIVSQCVVDHAKEPKYNSKPVVISERKIEIAGYYPKEVPSGDSGFKDPSDNPPPLPLSEPPKVNSNSTPVRNTSDQPPRKFSSNGELWRQDDKSERSVRDKIAMFSSQSSLEVPLFPNQPTTPTGPSSRRLSKHKSSDDVFADDKVTHQKDLTKSPSFVERTQSSFDLPSTLNQPPSPVKFLQRPPSLPKSSPPTETGFVYPKPASPQQKTPEKQYSAFGIKPYTSPDTGFNKSFDSTLGPFSPKSSTPTLVRATSFSGGTGFNHERPQTSSEVLSCSQISRTNSLVSNFKKPNEELRRSSLNQLIEQRRKGISKLRGLIIPEKDAVPVDQAIVDLPEIKSKDSILVNQVPKSSIQDKWGSQSSIASNTSTVSVPVKATTSFKMPAPQILSKYSPAFKRKSLSVYNTSSSISNSNSPTNGPKLNQMINSNPGLITDAPKSLESICSPTRSDYSFEYLSSTGSPENLRSRPRIGQKKTRADYDDSDNDSAVSSSQSSISRGFSPPMSPVPSDRSTMSSERSYISSETNYQRRTLILDTPIKNNEPIISDGNSFSTRSHILSERIYQSSERSLCSDKSSSSGESSNPRSPTENSKNSLIPQRQILKRTCSNDTNCSNSSTLTSGSQASAESLSRRVLKPQSVEAINRQNILASAKCRSGRDLNGSPLIQRKFSDDEETPDQGNESYHNQHRENVVNGDSHEKEVKIAYIEISEDFIADEKPIQKQSEEPKLPPKRSIPQPVARPPKSESLEPSNDLKMWVRTEAKNLAEKASGEKVTLDLSNPIKTRSRSSLTLDEQTATDLLGSRNRNAAIELEEAEKNKLKSKFVPNKNSNENDLLTILTTKSRSRSAIHVEESSYGKSRSQMSLEDILTVKCEPKLTRTQSVTIESSIERNGSHFEKPNKLTTDVKSPGRRSNSSDAWADEKTFTTKIPALNRPKVTNNVEEPVDVSERSRTSVSKIPTSRSLGRRSASVTDMKKAFEKTDSASPSATPVGNSLQPANNHNRFPSLDSSVEESIRPVGTEGDTERFCSEQFGSISSLASSTSLISQQELAQLVEEASLEDARGSLDVIVVLLHKENPAGSVGITLAGGVDCEAKEITVHRVLSHSIADKDGRVQRGDRILSINGRSTRGLSHRESLAVLKQPRSEVVLVVSRARLDEGCKLKTRTESVETIVEGYEMNGGVENTAWGPPSTVAIYKDGAGLGFSLEGGRDSPLGDRPLIIKKIFTGGAAEKTGALKSGDQLLEVNGNDVTRMSRIEAWSLMKKLHDGEVNLLVRHPATKSS